jgi:hypothetical protein
MNDDYITDNGYRLFGMEADDGFHYVYLRVRPDGTIYVERLVKPEDDARYVKS